MYQRIVLTGSDGVVGGDLKEVLSPNTLLISRHSKTDPIDITDYRKINDAILRYNPDLIIHLAAMVDVDYCEIEREKCMKTNVYATENLCNMAKYLDIPILYASTFFVYNSGEDRCLSDITDIPDMSKLHNTYSRSKLAGEMVVKELCKKHFIVRFGAMLGGIYKDKKFVKKILTATLAQDTIDVVSDRIVSLSYSKDLANNILSLIDSQKFGTYNMVNQGAVNYYDYAKKIVEFAGLKTVVNPIKNDKFSEPGHRGQFLYCSNDRLKEIGLDFMPHWEVSLKSYIEEIKIYGEWMIKKY